MAAEPDARQRRQQHAIHGAQKKPTTKPANVKIQSMPVPGNSLNGMVTTLELK